MKPFRSVALALGLVLLFGQVFSFGADDEKKPGRGQKGRGGFERFAESRPLLSQDAADTLKLTSEQKEKVAKLEKEFAEKDKETSGKAREALKKAFEDKDKDAMKKAFEDMRDVREKASKLREEYLGKVAGVLTDEQKKKFDDMKQAGPRGFGPGRRPEGGRTEPGRRPEGGQREAALPLDQLNLTTEQKEKIAKLRKELEGKIMDVLTPEQKKKIEELKKDRPEPSRRSRRSET